jgi:hypothetical protein
MMPGARYTRWIMGALAVIVILGLIASAVLAPT